MKKIFVTLFAVATVFTTVSAQVERKTEGRQNGQERSKGEGGKHDRGDKFAGHNEAFKELNLTSDQQTRIKSINEDFKTQMQSLQKNDGLTVKESRERREALIQDHQSKIQSLLTADQKTKLEQIKAEHKSKGDKFGGDRKDGAGRDGKMGKGPDFDKLKAELNLTDDQLTKIKIKQNQVKDGMKAIKDDNSLTDAQKKEKVQQLRKDSRETFQALLTPEQQKKMQEMRKNHKGNKQQS